MMQSGNAKKYEEEEEDDDDVIRTQCNAKFQFHELRGCARIQLCFGQSQSKPPLQLCHSCPIRAICCRASDLCANNHSKEQGGE